MNETNPIFYGTKPIVIYIFNKIKSIDNKSANNKFYQKFLKVKTKFFKSLLFLLYILAYGDFKFCSFRVLRDWSVMAVVVYFSG